jgi:predicted ATP-grasp superfamily ATP-dependent carboligase
MDGFITQQVIKQVRRVLAEKDYRKEMVDHNFKTARRFYSYSVLRRNLRTLLTSLTGMSS